MNQIKSFLNTEVDRVSFCKTTADKTPEEYLIDVLLAVKSKRIFDDYKIAFQNSTTITFEYKGLIG